MQELYIDSIDLVKFSSRTSLPTSILYYPKGEYVIGYEAEQLSDGARLPNKGFKVDLGETSPDVDVLRRKQYKTAGAADKSAVEITGDFIRGYWHALTSGYPKSD